MFYFVSSRRRHTRFDCDWSSDVCSSDLLLLEEQAYCLQFQDPIPRIAARFSAKEAIAKALGTGFGQELSFLDIEIKNNQTGKPFVELSPRANLFFHNPK